MMSLLLDILIGRLGANRCCCGAAVVAVFEHGSDAGNFMRSIINYD